MALNSITKKSNQGRDIKYLNKDFSKFRKNLIEYGKTYFPQTYSDFNESSHRYVIHRNEILSW